jgi:RNA polymerase sigma-70 factor (ECF subfamily)
VPSTLARRRPAADAALSELLARAQAGDESAFERLYREHVGRVYALCLRMLADEPAAHERTQDVFVRAWERLASFRGESAFSTWLHRLAVNEVLMWLRARGRLREDSLSEGEGLTAATTTDPGARLDLERAVAALPPGARRVLVLHDIEGFEHAEIAELLGIAEGTSKAQLFRARRLLREMLEP